MTNDYLRDLDDWDEESQQILLSLTKENAFLSFKEMEKGVFGKEGKYSFEKIRITANSDRMISPFYKEFGLEEGESIKVDVPISIFNYTGKKTFNNKNKTNKDSLNEKTTEEHGYAYETLVQVEDTGTKVFEAYEKEKSGFNPYHVKLYYEKLNNQYFNFSGRNCIVNIGNTYYKNFMSQFPKKKIRSWYDNRTKSIIVDSIELEAKYTKLVLDSVHQDNQLSEVDIYKAIQLNAWSKSEAGSILNAIGSINDGMAEAVTKIAELIGKCKIEEKRYLADDKEYKPFLFDKTLSSPTILSIGIGITVLEKLVQKNLSLLIKLNVENYLPSGFKKAIEELRGFTTKVNTMIKSAVTIVADIAGEYLKLVNAFVCGLINGLISLFEFAFQIISFMIGLDGFIKSYDDYLEQQKNIETLEEVLNFLFSEASTFLDGFINLIKDLKNTTSEDFEALIRSLSEKLGNISRYQYAYYAGNIVFEVIIGVLLAVFTGGAGNAVKAANTTEKFLHYLKIIGREFISTVTFGITDLLAILRKLIQSFARVCKNGFKGFIEWIRSLLKTEGRRLDEVLDEVGDLEEVIVKSNKKLKDFSEREILEYLKRINFHDYYSIYDLKKIWLRSIVLKLTLKELDDFVKTGSLLKIERRFITEEIEFFAKQNRNKFALQKPKSIKGQHSKRDFDVNNSGGKILSLDWQNVEIFDEGLEMVKKHLERFEPDDWNDRMIIRLEKIINKEIPTTDFDKRFYTHEIREYRRYKNLGNGNVKYTDISENAFQKIWDNTHAGTLEDYKIFEKIEYKGKSIYSLYHPDVQF
ncbi:hypothetical protein [Empedobacter brevis]|uniref:hypothetical protein n=1 Tax=Empedobacter brevis TaxID=247 RepID=UPI0028AFEE05|nr:hypothetical protein [Empedobacter brevis]